MGVTEIATLPRFDFAKVPNASQTAVASAAAAVAAAAAAAAALWPALV